MLLIETDVVVIGGGFAGLNFTRHASLNGIKTIVLEKNIGIKTNSTGIFIRKLVEEMKIPKKFISNKINRINLYFPNNSFVTIPNKSYEFFMSHTEEFLEWLKESSIQNGAVVKNGVTDVNFEKKPNGILVKIKSKNGIETIKARYVIGADGANSKVAREFKMSTNTRYLVAMEKVYELTRQIHPNSFYCFLDCSLAPGYLAWVAPRSGEMLVGLAGYPDRFKIDKSYILFVKKLKKMGIVDLENKKPLKNKAGILPVNGVLNKIVSKECLLVGDSAGQISALTAGGIYPIMKYSKIAADVVKRYIIEKDAAALDWYNKICQNDINAKIELLLRNIYDKFDDKIFNDFTELLKTKDGKELIKIFLFKHHAKHILIQKEMVQLLEHPGIYPQIGKILIDELKSLIESK